MLKLRQIVFALALFMMLLLTGYRALWAAQWHSSNQVTWTVGKACRDGAVITALYALPPVAILDEHFDAYRYLEEFDQYPVLIDFISYDPTKVGDLVGAVEVPREPTKEVPLIVDFGTEHVRWDYTITNLYWDEELSVGEIVALNWRAVEGKQFILAVEDCFIAPDATVKLPELTVKATVGLESDTCARQSTIITTPLTPVYGCLYIENRGDLTFHVNHLTDQLGEIDKSFALTITPGTTISITHAIAQEAELPFSLGPYSGEYDATNLFTWQASGGGAEVAREAGIVINRNNPEAVFQYLPIVRRN